MRILIADDDPVPRRTVRAALAGDGHEVSEASDGQIAWDLLERESISLVIADWMMPVLQGPRPAAPSA